MPETTATVRPNGVSQNSIFQNTQTPRPRIGVLLVQLGTPDSPAVPDVRKYLREFLMDGRVIDIPFIARFLLVNGIIAPFRAPKSAKIYKQLWTERGSPLKFHSQDVTQLLQDQLGGDYKVVLGMRYQSPSLPGALEQLNNIGLEKIIVIPLFPQYASASSGSVQQKVMELVSRWQIIPGIEFVSQFVDQPKFIETFAELGRNHMQKAGYDHFVFSYHGLPERQIRKGDCTNTCLKGDCCGTWHAMNRQCYRAQCFETTRRLAAALEIPEENYTVCFQSRLGKDPWVKPYTDDVIKELAARGVKRVLAFSPAFVADCLETTIEVGEEYREMFEEHGGQHWQLVESLNTQPRWIETLADMVKVRSVVPA